MKFRVRTFNGDRRGAPKPCNRFDEKSNSNQEEEPVSVGWSSKCDEISTLVDGTPAVPFTASKADSEMTTILGPENKVCDEPVTVENLHKYIIGYDKLITTPFGLRPLVYADWTASGRCVSFIEDFMRAQVLPYYANTHTESSITGRQTSQFREESRKIVAKAVNARLNTGAEDEDVVLFVGNGCTGAIHLLVSVLRQGPFRRQKRLFRRRPVVFVGPYEHHSNILMWRECGAKVVTVPEKNSKSKSGNKRILGGLDQDFLANELRKQKGKRFTVCSFSAASNVSGIQEDVDCVTAIAHQAGAVCFWDYAAAGPYTEIDMNPSSPDGRPNLLYKDAIFLSPHKFVGGPGSSGVLVVKKKLMTNSTPVIPGGGSVLFVTSKSQKYFKSIEAREEAGTPNILANIRAGLAFKLKMDMGLNRIEKLEETYARIAIARLTEHRNIEVVGNVETPRIPIISFIVYCGSRVLHHGYVCALLNDLFGIQSRGGCMCAGPYAQQLLKIDEATVDRFQEALCGGQEFLRPGFSRISFPYFMPLCELEYILSAIIAIADFGWRLLPRYHIDKSTGRWSHVDTVNASENLESLESCCRPTIPLERRSPRWVDELSSEERMKRLLDEGIGVMQQAGPSFSEELAGVGEDQILGPRLLHWFVFPKEAAKALDEESKGHPELSSMLSRIDA